MRFNKDLSYALYALEHLSYNKRTMTSKELAGTQLSVAFMEQVMRKLRIAGLVSVKRGPGGGFCLPKHGVNAFDVLRAFKPKTGPSLSLAEAALYDNLAYAFRGTNVC